MDSMVAALKTNADEKTCGHGQFYERRHRQKSDDFMGFQEIVDLRPLNSPPGLPRNHKISHGNHPDPNFSSKSFK